MSPLPPPNINCVHCKKVFQPNVVGANTRHAGYKCPHCKLYMPVGRAPAPVETAA